MEIKSSQSPAPRFILDGGVQSIEATFRRDRGDNAARFELCWQGPGFIKEPLNGRYLGHLPSERPKQFLADIELERGRFLFEELACIKCHKPTANDRMAKTLADRTGPNLTEIGKRAYPGWIDAWLADPAKLRPHTTMPKLFADDDRGRAERYAMTQISRLTAGKHARTVSASDSTSVTKAGGALIAVRCFTRSPGAPRVTRSQRPSRRMKRTTASR